MSNRLNESGQMELLDYNEGLDRNEKADQGEEDETVEKAEAPEWLDEVVGEELAELEKVRGQLAKVPPTRTASEEPILRELDRLRERLLSGDENKDHSALTEQYHNNPTPP